MWIFITGRPNFEAKTRRRLAKRVKGVSAGTSKDHIMQYLRVRLNQNEIEM